MISTLHYHNDLIMMTYLNDESIGTLRNNPHGILMGHAKVMKNASVA